MEYLLSTLLMGVAYHIFNRVLGNPKDQDKSTPNHPVKCSNCDGEPKIIDASDQCSRDFIVICQNCGKRKPYYATTESQAVKDWNDVNT